MTYQGSCHCGRIGYEVARRLAGFDLEIAYSDVGPRTYAEQWEFIADPVALAAGPNATPAEIEAAP